MDRRVYTFANVDLHSESQKAYHCQIGEGFFWVPKSQIKECDFDEGHLVTTTWWAEISGAQDAYEESLVRYEEVEAQAATPIVQLFKAQAVYRKLALKYHPDKNPDTAEMMRDLNELWQTLLSDLKKSGRR